MDSCQNFLKILFDAISRKDYLSLTDILKERRFLQFISIKHLEYILRNIFDPHRGLLYFLRESLDLITRLNHQKSKPLEDAIKESFYFLLFLIKNFYESKFFKEDLHLIQEIKIECEKVLSVKCYFFAKHAAYLTFEQLIERFEDHNLQLNQTAHHLFKLLDHKFTTTNERKFIFCILGKIFKQNKIGPLLLNNVDRIITQLCEDAWEKFNTPNAGKDIYFYMYFNIFADLLGYPELKQAQVKKKLPQLYKYIKHYNQPKTNEDKNSTREAKKNNNKTRNCAINLLSCHTNFFKDFIYFDCKYWYNVLRQLTRQTVNYNKDGLKTLKAIYRIIGQILTDRNKENAKVMLLDFLNDFEKELQNTNLNLITLRLLVYGYSQLAEPCKVHKYQSKIRQMYSTISSCAYFLCSSEQSDLTHKENICCYQEALSEILCHMTCHDITIEKINILVTLGVYTIEGFPDLIESKNLLAVSALIRTISNLGSINRDLLQRYLDSIIHDGIAWSCSHTLAVDVELQWEQNNLRQRPVCYKNYLPLWIELMNTDRYRIEERRQLAQCVANMLMDICITLINQLDIRVEEAKINTKMLHTNAAFAQYLVVNKADFHVFTNLVDLYVDVIEMSELSLFASTVHKFLYEIIQLSYKYPLVSGFYKLTRVGMKIIDTLKNDEKSKEQKQVEEFLSSYLTYTLDLLPAFSSELLIAYLYMILNAPVAYMKDSLSRMLPVYKIAFSIGLSNVELASIALTSLELWRKSQKLKQKEDTNKVLYEVLTFLEPYLYSTESSVEMLQDLVTTRKSVKRIYVIDSKCTLQKFRRRVLLFIGSLDHDPLLSFLHERASRNLQVSWDKKCLKYSLPLPDARPDIYFDHMLPRVIALARGSGDRHTKIAACEVLHSIITLVIGNTARHMFDQDNSFITLYGVLCPTMLTLGCDFDEAVRNLFKPLTLQFIYWLSSKCSSSASFEQVISHLLESLFDGLTDESNPALRNFSGECLQTFTNSLRKADTQEMLARIVQRIIQKINHLALHPTRKRIAAAVTFNYLYWILREIDEIVSVYWLEIFYCFVRSSDGCDDLLITKALAHVERVMREKANVLNVSDSHRRKPHEFEEATLTHALYWLLSQCGSLDERYRSKCMKLYTNISNYNDNHAQKTTRDFITNYGIERLNDIILGGLELYDNVSVFDNPAPLLKVLDCYVWLMKEPIENPSINEQLLSAEDLFPANDAGEHEIFSHIRNFVQQFWQIAASLVGTSTIKFKELQKLEKLQTLRCKTLIAILDFVQELLNVDVLPTSLWDEEALSALTITCIMHPRAVGFDVRDIEMTNKLPRVLETLLNSMKSKLGDTLPTTFKRYLSHFAQQHLTRLCDLDYIMQNDFCNELIQHVKGLILLKRCNVFDRRILEVIRLKNGNHTIKNIFSFLVSKYNGKIICSDLSIQMIEYLRVLMEFQFSLISFTLETPMQIIPEDARSMIETLVKLISDDTVITDLNSVSITHGEHFLYTFRNEIFKYMLANTNAFTIVFDDLSRNKPFFLLKWIEDLLLFLKRHRRELKDYLDSTVRAVLQQFMCLKSTIDKIDSKEKLINIYGIVVRLKPEIAREFSELRQWILNQLTGNDDLEYKMQVLRNFFVCLTDAPDRDDENLSKILNTLKTNKVAKQIRSFEVLLTLLSSTKSKLILKFAIHFAAGAGAHLFDEKLKKHLRRYYHGASIEHVLSSLEMIYREFMNTETEDETERLDILRGFLLPTFDFCDAVAIERFFEPKVPELEKISKEIIDNKCNDVAIKRSLLSKIGCFQLISIMFARAKNVIDKTGRELRKRLLRDILDTQKVQIERSNCKELERLMHCFAYNCMLSLISDKETEDVYQMAFGKERKEGNRLIWEIIVDCNKRYKLGQTFKKNPEIRETIVNVTSADDERDMRANRNSYVHTIDLSSCSLSEHINDYDFNRSVMSPFGSRHPVSQDLSQDLIQSVTSVALDSDDFNEHECMPYICALLRRAMQISGSCDKSPKWLKSFLYAVETQRQPNIQLFLLKIICNTADVFKHYAKFALTSIIQCTAAYLEHHDLNYIITDTLMIIMNIEIVPSDAVGRMEAQKLFRRFVYKVMTKKFETDPVNNLMYDMVKKWRYCLQVPTEFVEKMSTAPKAAVRLILAFFENGITQEIIVKENSENSEVVRFLLKNSFDWNTAETRNTALDSWKCLGLYLKLLDNIIDNENERENRRNYLLKKINKLHSQKSLEPAINQRVKCIAAFCEFYPEARFVKTVINKYYAMAGIIEKCSCLEVFHRAIRWRWLDADEITHLLSTIELERVLKNRILFSEELTLQIVHDLVTVLPSQELLPIVSQVIPYIKDDNTKHRELVYDIFAKIYEKYKNYTNYQNVQKLLSYSVNNLLTGLIDPSRDLQEKVLKFWREETDFSMQNSKDGLLALLDVLHKLQTWTTSEEHNALDDNFSFLIALMTLQLSTKSTEYNKKIFDTPLDQNCIFQEHKIEISWRRRNLSSVTPMFIESFASQVINSGTFLQSVDSNVRTAYSHFSHDAGSATHFESMQFEPTLDVMANVTETASTLSSEAEFDRATIAPNRSQQETTAYNKKFPTLLPNQFVLRNIRKKYYQENKKQRKIVYEESIKQSSSVKLNNNYRIGKYPDIEITHSSFIVSLQHLIKLDPLFCKQLTVLLLDSLNREITERESSDEFRESILEKLKPILKYMCKKESSFNAVILETFLNFKVTSCDVALPDVVKASKRNGLDVLGLCLLEHFLCNIREDDLPTPSKRMRFEANSDEIEQRNWWAQLASFYKSLNDVDVVLNILQEQYLGNDVQAGAEAEAEGDWIRAKDAYSRAYEETTCELTKEHSLQGLLEAVNNLCDWPEIDRIAKSSFPDRNLHNLWTYPCRDSVIPYLFDAYVHMTAEGTWTNSDDLEIIQSWVNTSDNLEHLKSLAGEDLIIFLMKTNQIEATHLLSDLLDNVGDQWVKLNPFCIELGMRKLQKLQILNDLNASLMPLRHENTEHLDDIANLLDFWSMKTPKIQDNLVHWNKLAAYRKYASTLFEFMYDELDNNDDESKSNEIMHRMRQINFQHRLDIGEVALKQKHRYIADKHLTYLKGIHNIDNKIPLKWFEARTKYLVADIEASVDTKLSGYAASWELSHSLLNENDELNASISTAIRKHISVLSSKIKFLAEENDEFRRMLMTVTEGRKILQDIGVPYQLTSENWAMNETNVMKHFSQYSLNNLRLCCEHETATDVGEHYYALARYCYDRYQDESDEEKDEIFREFVRSILKSMNHSYSEATHYFPCLLGSQYLLNEQTRETFTQQCAELPPWWFLRWRDLLFSHLGTSSPGEKTAIVDLVQPIIKRLAEKYPDAIVYTYHFTVERNPEILKDGRAQQIHLLLGDKAEQYKQFSQAIQYVAHPVLYLRYYIDELTKELSRGNAIVIENVESLWQKVSSIVDAQAVSESIPRPGKSYYKELAKFLKTIKSLDPNNLDVMQNELKKIKMDLMKKLLKGGRDKLSNFSPFLLEFAGGDIEIPGQYSSDREPMPRYHTKIAGFEPDVMIMPSLRKPIRISMIGDDGKRYKFLVKFGEDLTIDCGIQQLFVTMNKTLRNDISCRQRRLAIDTYEVIPLSRSFGLIQWIANMKSLKDLIQLTLSPNDIAQCNSIRKDYKAWIEQAKASTRGPISDLYKKALFKYNKSMVEKKMRELTRRTKETALRQAFVTAGSSWECFVMLRRNFIASYATMCVAHWLMGVGDRHLQNILVSGTGRCLGIDFGHAFDAAIRASVPELVPFRLTSQMLSLLKPFDKRDPLATIMIHVLRALRNDRNPILACMDIFVDKPANRSVMINDDEGNEDVNADLRRSDREDIEMIKSKVAKKLNGIHPSFIMLEQLREAHGDDLSLKYTPIVFGRHETVEARGKESDVCLTPDKQVLCLLDQAKDLNCLGRMYVNWEPWL